MATDAGAPAAPPVEEALAWEAEQRPRTALASIAAGLLLFGTFLYATLAFGDSPHVLLTDGFRDALGRPLGTGEKGLLTESARWFSDHAAPLLVVTTLAAIGTALLAVTLGYLFRATQARRPETSRFMLYLALIGPILYGFGPLVSAISAVVNGHDYIAKGVYSTVGAHDALRTGTAISTAQVLVGIGQLATAVAIVFIALNAMRVGLLTRFMGILGCIVGALLVLPAVLGPPAIVQSFWLVALGALFLGRLGATPPAWVTGRAQPWPSQQELRERKDAGIADAPAPEPVAAAEPGTGSVAVADASQSFGATKRKRKRR